MTLYVRYALILATLLLCWLVPYSAQLNNPNERTRVLQAISLADSGDFAIGRRQLRGEGRGWSDPWGRITPRMFVNDLALVCADAAARSPECDGSLYPAKAPGVALAGAVALRGAAALRVLRLDDPAHERRAHLVVRYSVVTPLMVLGLFALVGLLRAARVAPLVQAITVLAAAGGTGLLTYGSSAVGHAVAGACAVIGLWLWSHVLPPSPPLDSLTRHTRAYAAGFFAAAPVLFEYHAVLLVIPAAVWMACAPGAALSTRAAAAAGGLVAFLAHAASHLAMFGSITATGHRFLASASNRRSQSDGFLGLDRLRWEAFEDAMVDPYMGLLFFSPWLIFSAVGVGATFAAVVARRRRAALPLLDAASPDAASPDAVSPDAASPGTGGAGPVAASTAAAPSADPSPSGNASRDPAPSRLPREAIGPLVVLAVMCILYLLFIASPARWRMMNGWSIGPRYLMPAVFPLTVLAGVGIASVMNLRSGRLAVAVLGALSVLVTGLTTAAFPSPDNRVLNLWRDVALPTLHEGCTVATIASPLLPAGLQVLLVWALILTTALAIIVLASRGLARRGATLFIVASLALLLGSATAFTLTDRMDEELRTTIQRAHADAREGVCLPGGARP